MKYVNKYKFQNDWVSFKSDVLQIVDFEMMNFSSILKRIGLYVEDEYISTSGICCGKCLKCNRFSLMCECSKGDVYYVSEDDANILKEKNLLKDILVTLHIGANNKWWTELIDLGYEILSIRDLEVKNNCDIKDFLWESIIISYKELLEIYDDLKNDKELREKLSKDTDNFIDWEIFGCWIRDYLPFLNSFMEE